MSSAPSFASSTPARIDLALFFIRIAATVAFLYHGSAIAFGAFGGPGPQGFAAFTHMPLAVAYLVGLGQFAGGLAMLTGIFLRIGAAGIIIIMLGAIFMVHLPHGVDVNKGGYEYALTQLLVACALFLAGPGKYSLSNILPAPLRNL